MDVGDERDVDVVPDRFAGGDVPFLGDGHPDDLTADLLKPLDLLKGGRGVGRVGGGHRLDQDRVLAADDVVAEPHLSGLVPLDRGRVGHRCVASVSFGKIRALRTLYATHGE